MLILGVAVLIGISISASNSFQQCVQETASQKASYELFGKVSSVPSFLSLVQRYIGCGTSTVDTHNGTVGALATLVIAWLTISLVSVTSRQAELTEASVKVAEKALIEIERAFVFIDGFNTELSVLSDQIEPDLSVLKLTVNKDPALHITRLAVQPRWKNSGGTPTKNMRFRVNWAGPAETILPDYRFVENASSFFVGPNAVESSDFIRVTGGEYIIAHSIHCIGPEPLICIWGRAEYEDVFGKAHFQEWCYRLRLERHKRKDQPMRATMIQYGDFNCSD